MLNYNVTQPESHLTGAVLEALHVLGGKAKLLYKNDYLHQLICLVPNVYKNVDLTLFSHLNPSATGIKTSRK